MSGLALSDLSLSGLALSRGRCWRSMRYPRLAHASTHLPTRPSTHPSQPPVQPDHVRWHHRLPPALGRRKGGGASHQELREEQGDGPAAAGALRVVARLVAVARSIPTSSQASECRDSCSYPLLPHDSPNTDSTPTASPSTSSCTWKPWTETSSSSGCGGSRSCRRRGAGRACRCEEIV